MQLFLGVQHVLMRFFDRIEFALLISGQHWPNLRQCAVHHCMHLLHRLLMNGGDLRFGRVKDRLNLRLLISSQVQLFGDPLQAELMAMPVSAPPGPACACTTTKPPSAIAPAAAIANRFLFIVGFICFCKALFAPLKDMTVRVAERLQNF